MSKVRNYVSLFCTLFTLLFTTVVATPHQTINTCKEDLLKKYVPSNSLVFSDGKMFVIEDGAALEVSSLHQDNGGIFIIYPIYGTCPNGHPYDREGGCYGHNCPYN